MTAPPHARPSRALLLLLGFLAVGLVIAVALLVAVAGPPSYQPVPVPSVSQT